MRTHIRYLSQGTMAERKLSIKISELTCNQKELIFIKLHGAMARSEKIKRL